MVVTDSAPQMRKARRADSVALFKCGCVWQNARPKTTAAGAFSDGMVQFEDARLARMGAVIRTQTRKPFVSGCLRRPA
jgi:hypothetical protein